MKKFFFSFILFILLVAFLVPQPAMGALVPCGNVPPANFVGPPTQDQQPCTLSDFFVLIANVYNFIVFNIATPLATLMVVIGGILMLLSGINANWFNTGKNMIKWSIIAILLIWSAVLIIDTVFKAIGYTGNWQTFP